MDCNVDCLIITEGHLKVTGSQVHHMYGTVLEMVQDRDVVM